MRELAANGESFAFETTLASRSFASWSRELQGQGYIVHIVYLWLESPELAISRVADRVSLGGHDIPEDVIRRRYRLSLHNLWNLYWPTVNHIYVFNNTLPAAPELVAIHEYGAKVSIQNEEMWLKFKESCLS